MSAVFDDLPRLLTSTLPAVLCRHIVLERPEVAIRATLLDGSAEGAREPDEWITGPGERHYLEEHGFIW